MKKANFSPGHKASTENTQAMRATYIHSNPHVDNTFSIASLVAADIHVAGAGTALG